MDKPLSFASKVTAPDSVLIRELAGEAVLLDLDSGAYFGLDDVGTHMWGVLTTSPSIEAAYTALLEQYDVAPEVLEADLRAWIGQLVDQGLLLVTS